MRCERKSVCQSPHAQSIPIPTQSTCYTVNMQARTTYDPISITPGAGRAAWITSSCLLLE